MSAMQASITAKAVRNTERKMRFVMSRLRPVAHAAHGADDGARLAQLLAQGADVDVHSAGLAVVVRAPDLAEQPVAREHHAGAGHEGVEQLELLERQRYLLPVRRHAAAL